MVERNLSEQNLLCWGKELQPPPLKPLGLAICFHVDSVVSKCSMNSALLDSRCSLIGFLPCHMRWLWFCPTKALYPSMFSGPSRPWWLGTLILTSCLLFQWAAWFGETCFKSISTWVKLFCGYVGLIRECLWSDSHMKTWSECSLDNVYTRSLRSIMWSITSATF